MESDRPKTLIELAARNEPFQRERQKQWTEQGRNSKNAPPPPPAPRRPWVWIEEDRGYETPCHIWQGAVNSRGYGTRNAKLIHRERYMEEVGPIPEGLQLDHLCDVRLCCNPAHCKPVTGAENRRRGKHIRLSAEIAEEIRNSPLSSHKLARIYNVSAPTIQAVRNGESWKHL